MSKILRPRGLARNESYLVLSALRDRGTVSTEDLTSLNIRGRYLYKYICALRKEGHKIIANRQGRFVVSYTLEHGEVAKAA